ncbi:HAMP domain-containing sensor histidine kinase [Clostridium perfringens]|uniref:histidine kinase n=1 Tax=Clostridium perfringens TaxID=1502 RepID=A0A6G4ZDD1_CLOPF|nr:HAMP domain-containing sensor histidine kinase [Clostridium perfringens]MDK0701349.1 HAMP domain-containing sensor histidine kinase [Clostridium perfringens]MDM0859611.1 HAMP domain-containing sensor histidine kinase [Clostridium perfringens]MDM0871343.1 HAMP domain-containing sensor histidine kinase [Clostridium perfringens]MDM0874351.1 HAMP domain-containing sensor histidine kinase [Clostridium perfringens]MDM0883067.1 HAMP domain-containing sensor histidine kinase [Clostridium perfringen
MKVRKYKSLNFKVIVPSIVIIIIVTLLTVVISKFYFDKKFGDYIMIKNQNTVQNILMELSEQYSDNEWNYKNIEKITYNSLDKGIIVALYDKEDKEIMNIEKNSKDKCNRIMNFIKSSMEGKYGSTTSQFEPVYYPLIKSGEKIGEVRVKFYGPIFYMQNELVFLDIVNRIILGIGVLLILASTIMGFIISRSITRPINKLMTKAKYISKGEYDKKIEINTDILEINDLINSINNLSQSIKEQENIRKRLTGDISHELKTPLTNIQSHLEAMIDGIWEPTEERLLSVKEEAERLSSLVSDMQKLNKYDESSIKLKKDNVNISDIICFVIFQFSNLAKSKNIKIEYEKKNINLYCDKDKITQALVNILSNAIRYSNEGSTIFIEEKLKDNKVIISIEDQGIGISEEDLKYVFERFYRADKSRTRATGGTGIGLTIVKSIVSSHGGEVKLESKLGEGSKFTIILPKEDI